MLVAVAVAALSYVGAKGNFGNAVKVANELPVGAVPAFVDAGTPPSGGAHAATSTAIGPSTGGFSAAGSQMVKHQGEGGSTNLGAAADSDKPAPSKHDGDQASQHPSNDLAEAHGPAKLTGPSGKPDPLASPTGRRAVPSPVDKDPANIRALAQENESADILAKNGYRVEQRPKFPGRKNPDYRIEGDIFDNYAPTTSSPRSIWTTIQDKVVKEQARRIVLNLSSSGVDLVKLKIQFDNWPIDTLEQILVIRNGSIIRFWP